MIKQNVTALLRASSTQQLKKHVLVRIGYIEDLERGRKEHERNGWEMVAFKVEPRATENRFKRILQEFGFGRVAGKGKGWTRAIASTMQSFRPRVTSAVLSLSIQI